MIFKRAGNRGPGDLRRLKIKRRFTRQAPGSVLFQMGRTTVLCTCCVEESVPPFLLGTGKGWLTAEYAMLPGSTGSRKPRDRSGKIDGRSIEIQRLIGRSLRTVVNLNQLGERTLWIDCDVLEADGGTRTAAINGAWIALVDALHSLGRVKEVVTSAVAAVSVGLHAPEIGVPIELLDLDYEEDRQAAVDLNLVMTYEGRLVEVQAGGEEATFSRDQLEKMLNLGKQGIVAIFAAQRDALGSRWPLY